MRDEHGMRALKGVRHLGGVEEAAWVDDERSAVVVQPNAGVRELRQAHVTPLR
jgi:hypothetical protein